jgi:hypothetical protein
MSQQNLTGMFVPTTNIWDTQVLYEMDYGKEGMQELFVRLYQNLNLMALALNAKETGYYIDQEFVTGSVFFGTASTNQSDLRSVFRKVINVGSVGAGATTKAHGLAIGTTWSFTKIYGAVSNTTTNNYLPLPWVNTTTPANSIELKVDATNIVITNNSGLTFPTCMVVLEYLKQ